MGKMTWAAVHLDEAELARLDALVAKDCSSRSAVLRKALRCLEQVEASTHFLPGANPIQLRQGSLSAGVGGVDPRAEVAG